MKKFATLFTVLLAAAFAFGVAVAVDVPEKIVIKDVQKEKNAVIFNHKAHHERVKGDCQVCHHQDKRGAERKCSTAECHGLKAEGKKPILKEAFHTRCKGCHTTNKKGPTKCPDCHKGDKPAAAEKPAAK
jgi:hypothetical protein